MILRTGVIALLFALCLSGCSATKPVVWKAQDVSFTNFKAFEIQPVFNATGKTIDKDLLSFFTAHLKEQFKLQNLQLIDTPQTKSEVLIVQTEISVYETNKTSYLAVFNVDGAGRKAHCTLRTRLVNKQTGNVVARILTVKEVSVGNKGGKKPQEWVLKETAAAVAKEVVMIMQAITPG